MLEKLSVLVGFSEEQELAGQQKKRGFVSRKLFFLEVALDELGNSELALRGAAELGCSFDLPAIEFESFDGFLFKIGVHSIWLIIV